MAETPSRVEITVIPSDGPTRLLIRETRLAAASVRMGPADAGRSWALACAGIRWELRLACLAFGVMPARLLVVG